MDDSSGSVARGSLSETESVSSLSGGSESDIALEQLEIPKLSLPSGGGALKGIDEKFQVNAANGTAQLSVSLPLSVGRANITPPLVLGYNSGSGNGPFGMGWSLSAQQIQVKADITLPKYTNHPDELYSLSGKEDLVPYLDEQSNGDWLPRHVQAGNISIRRYRPRIEAGFDRIEKISHPDIGVYWKVTTGENIVTYYGTQEATRLVDPKDGKKIFQWLADFSFDDRGNWIQYEYKPEDLVNTPNNVFEKNRHAGLATMTNRYLKRVKYGNRIAFYGDPANPYIPPIVSNTEHFFEVVFDYGEHDADLPMPLESTGMAWNYRSDAFSSYRPGFEVRTQRLCSRVLMFHHFKNEAAGENLLVKSLDFEYTPSSVNQSGLAEVTYLTGVVESGHIKKPDGSYSTKSLPKQVFGYQQVKWDNKVKVVSPDNLIHAPVGLTDKYQWTDLYAEGISGILSRQGNHWYYKSNLGSKEQGAAGFSRAVCVRTRPGTAGPSGSALAIQDLEANGSKQLVVNQPPMAGYYELNIDETWESFVPFARMPSVDLNSPHLRRIDLDGDGRNELLIAEQQKLIWYPSAGKAGYGEPYHMTKSLDEEQGPSVVFSGQNQSIFLADMSGDGLTDIVRIKNSEVAYWPNMGYGRFGAKVSLGNVTTFDHSDTYDPDRLYLADVSGTGTTDILYIADGKCSVYLNLSGNALSDAHRIDSFFPVDDRANITVIDLLGTGTSCIVWSSTLPRNREQPMRYIDLMAGKKPHVLVSVHNSLGKELTLEYQSSTYFYLQDKQAGTPWITKLPFPVQVVSRATLEEKITDVRFTTSYSYHHGFYDHAEREFRGFGRVDQQDSEFYPEWKLNVATTTMEREETLYQSPVLTKTWFHTGAYLQQESLEAQFEKEYWSNNYNQQFPATSLIPIEAKAISFSLVASQQIQGRSILSTLSPEERREAIRACKGLVLRKEIFALDAPASGATETQLQRQATPFIVDCQSCEVQLLQPRSNSEYAVFLPMDKESLTYTYERAPLDPRISHELIIQRDHFGNVLEKAQIAYGRNTANVTTDFHALRNRASDFAGSSEQAKLQAAFDSNLQLAEEAQTRASILYSSYTYTQFDDGANTVAIVDLPHVYQLRKMSNTREFEITGLSPASVFYTTGDFSQVLGSATSLIPFDATPGATPQRRLVGQVKTLFYADDLTGSLAQDRMDSRSLVYESQQLVTTTDFLDTVFKDATGATLKQNGNSVADSMQSSGGYVKDGDTWWVRSGRAHYLSPDHPETVSAAQARFLTTVAFEDSMSVTTRVFYDSETVAASGVRNNDGYYLFVKETRDAIDNTTLVDQFDYRALQPTRMIDVNANPTSVLIDELGYVVAMALEGNGYNSVSGSHQVEAANSLAGLDGYQTQAQQDSITLLLTSSNTTELMTQARILLGSASSRLVNLFDTYTASDSPATTIEISRVEHHNENSGSDLLIQFTYSDGLGNVVMKKQPADPGVAWYMENGIKKSKNTSPDLRWIGDGRTVLNNKGNSVKKFEPFFSLHPHYENDSELIEGGVSPVVYYDPMGRVITTRYPDATSTKVEFSAWQQQHFDKNDCLQTDDWYLNRVARSIDQELITRGLDPVREESSAQQVAHHHDTPSILLLDALNRPVLNLVNNGRDRNNKEEFHSTFIELDILSNTRAVFDARSNQSVQYSYSMTGKRLMRYHLESGRRWTFANVLGDPVNLWDEQGHVHFFSYDAINRVVSVQAKGGPSLLDHTYQRIVYGEGTGDDQRNNLRLQAISNYDTAGKTTNVRYDFMGNLLESTREFTEDYKSVVNWSGILDSKLDATLGRYTTLNAFDALARLVRITAPDGSIVERRFDAGLNLQQVVVTQVGQSAKIFVDAIDYNEKGQRLSIRYGNGVTTDYVYDPLTFRLIQLATTKLNGEFLQDLHYSYDPVGNISSQVDRSIPVVFFSGAKIEGGTVYLYDPLYRLTSATGREHAGQKLNFSPSDNVNDLAYLTTYQANDAMAWRNYTQSYGYDPVGNLLTMNHQVSGAGNATHNWIRQNSYESTSNRLIRSQVGGVTLNYVHDPAHGTIISLPHLSVMTWNFKDELVATSKQAVTTGIPEITYYVYDGSGHRIRKVTELQGGGGRKEERLYLGQVELYKKYTGASQGLERFSLHVMDEEQRVALIDTRNQVDDGSPQRATRYQLANQLGSSTIELDELAQVISYEEYHPYGTTSYSATSASNQVPAKRYRYSGMERDDETGMNYHSARYYLPWLGRWLSPDQEGIADGLNLYAYVQGRVTLNVDISGRAGNPAQRLNVDLLLASEEEVVAGWLREYAISEVSIDEKNKVDSDGDPYYKTSNEITLEHSGAKSVDPNHCTDYVMNTMHNSGLTPLKGGTGKSMTNGAYRRFYRSTKATGNSLRKLEQWGIVERVEISGRDKTKNIRPGDIWLKVPLPENKYGHTALIRGVDKAAQEVLTREANSDQVNDERQPLTSNKRVYRLVDVNEEAFKKLYDSDADFRKFIHEKYDEFENQENEARRKMNSSAIRPADSEGNVYTFPPVDYWLPPPAALLPANGLRPEP